MPKICFFSTAQKMIGAKIWVDLKKVFGCAIEHFMFCFPSPTTSGSKMSTVSSMAV
jgi:hypothetical protein